ncbi:MAG: tyrosine-protein phosphatase [Clostridia bacterium]|nr:tyrosine-protein phosphatase [Clostridia bacterium]
MKRFLSLLTALLVVLSFLPAAGAEVCVIGCEATVGGLENDVWMTKYGNVVVDVAAADFLGTACVGYGDLMEVSFLGQTLVLPVVPAYSYVDSGKPAIIAARDAAGAPTGPVLLAINMGNFATTYGIADKHTNEDKTWYWTAKEGVTFPLPVSFTLRLAGGYHKEYLLHDLHRTNERADYAELSDEAFANFRAVTTPGMGAGKLYRSSSPINPELGRNAYACKAMEQADVKTIVNLADTAAGAAEYEGFAESYYAKQNAEYLCLGVDFFEPSFRTGLADGLRFMIANPGPYLVHCNEGKDRAGFVSALLECLMGAPAEAVVADYMTTYANYYGVEPGTEKYDVIAESNIVKTLSTAFRTDDLANCDLAAAAEAYLAEIGLSAEETAALKANLG